MTETIKTVSTPEMLAAAQQAYNRAKRERLIYGKRICGRKRILKKLYDGDIENSKGYQERLSREKAALAQLEALRKTQLENVFIERNAAKGINQ